MKILLTAEQLAEGVERLARETAEFYQGRPVTILGVLTGSIVLVSDLIRRVESAAADRLCAGQQLSRPGHFACGPGRAARRRPDLPDATC